MLIKHTITILISYNIIAHDVREGSPTALLTTCQALIEVLIGIDKVEESVHVSTTIESSTRYVDM